jgi:hypothetical protein
MGEKYHYKKEKNYAHMLVDVEGISLLSEVVGTNDSASPCFLLFLIPEINRVMDCSMLLTGKHTPLRHGHLSSVRSAPLLEAASFSS